MLNPRAGRKLVELLVCFIALSGSKSFAVCMHEERAPSQPQNQVPIGGGATETRQVPPNRVISYDEFISKRQRNATSDRERSVPAAQPPTTNLVDPCYSSGGGGGYTGDGVYFVTAQLDTVFVEVARMQSPVTWQELTATYFPVEIGGGGGGGNSTPTPPPSPIPKPERCSNSRTSCIKSADRRYDNAIKSCDELKPGIPVGDLVVVPIRAHCRDQALGNADIAEQRCEARYAACLAAPGP
jgi:hypothetical protein